MNLELMDPALEPVAEKVVSGVRLSREDALLLYRSHDLLGIGQLATMVRERLYGKKTFYVYNQHLNYTNVCINRCLFCAYSKDKGENGAFTLSVEEVIERIRKRESEPIREVHIVGGLNPDLPFSYYLDLIRTVKTLRPEATIKAFTAVEIDHMSHISGLGLKDVFTALKEAGLCMMPGGGAEVLSERIHRKLYPRKIGPERWMEVIRTAHESGIPTNATMLYGHIETLEERVEHLLKLRSLQDETGGIQAFIPLAFHSKNTRLPQLPPTVAMDDLKTIAISRLILDNIPHIKAYWVMITPALAQVAMAFGADDLDGTIVEEKITHMAGATTPRGLSRDEIKNLIFSCGYEPVERDAFYEPIGQSEDS
ncbi:MAG: aminofutalosine synthase MqnE [Deltaproteobacteria bacterium]|nr:aminofutalosine synthase MqnE [Deltaproteobacteria bacterium]